MSASESPNARGTDRPTGGTHDGLRVDAGQADTSTKYGHERLTPPHCLVHPERRGRGPGRSGLTGVLEQLSPRDIAVIDLIADHRFLTTRHLEVFCFYDHATAASGARTARRVLTRLERLRLIERPIRRVGGMTAGSASSVWMLTSVGQRLRGLRSGIGDVGRVRAPGERFVAHYLAVADAHLALVAAQRTGQLIVTHLALEPACWRTYSGLGGGREILKPDLAAVTATSREADYEDHWFVEIDRGTESLPTVLRQCQRYEAYRRSGIAQNEDGVFPLVVWVVPDRNRAGKLAAAIHAARGMNDNFYRVTVLDGFIGLIAGGAA